MTNEEAKAIIRKEYLCVDRDCDIERSCGKCDLMMPSKEPILEAYKMAIKALEREQQKYTRPRHCDCCGVLLTEETTSVVMSYVMSVMSGWNRVWKGAGMKDEELRVRAIQELEFHKKDDTFMLADITVDLAIEALKQMPVTTTAGEGGVIYYPQVEGVTPTVIDAGKQEPCEDAISRQAVLNGLASITKAKAKSDAQKSLMGRVMFFTEQLPPVNPTKTGQWIPVSERLPEKYTYTLWCASSGYVRSDYFNGEFWKDAKKYCYEVIAWMPLPKPYEPQERSDKE